MSTAWKNVSTGKRWPRRHRKSANRKNFWRWLAAKSLRMATGKNVSKNMFLRKRRTEKVCRYAGKNSVDLWHCPIFAKNSTYAKKSRFQEKRSLEKGRYRLLRDKKKRSKKASAGRCEKVYIPPTILKNRHGEKSWAHEKAPFLLLVKMS